MAQVTTPVKEFNLTGPYAVSLPTTTDTVGVDNRPFDRTSLLGSLSLSAAPTGTFSGDVLPTAPSGSNGEKHPCTSGAGDNNRAALGCLPSVGLLSFYINNTAYLDAQLKVEGPRTCKVFVDGQETRELKLSPDHHRVAIKYLVEVDSVDSLRVSIEAPVAVSTTLSASHPFGPHDMLDGTRISAIEVSPDGQYVLVSYTETERGGNTKRSQALKYLSDGRTIRQQKGGGWRWMPRSCAYLQEEETAGSRQLFKVNPVTGEQTILASHLPEGHITVSPEEDYLILSCSVEGPAEDPDAIFVSEPDDRQPQFRQRSYLAKYDLATGLAQQLTFGPQSSYLADISPDGSQLLISTYRTRLEKRPFNVVDVILMDVRTLQADTLLRAAEFISQVSFSPNGKQLLVQGSAEAFDGIGLNLPEGRIPSEVDGQLFIYDLATRTPTAITRTFDPSCEWAVWSRHDGNIYINTTDRDCAHLYVYKPSARTFTLLETGDDVVQRVSLPVRSGTMCYTATGALTPAKLYALSLKTGKSRLMEDPTAHQYADVQLGTYTPWTFIGPQGDTIQCGYYLPYGYDEGSGRQLPVIVNYYGGCSPTQRILETRYPQAYYANMGYAVLVINPSGAAGFGQEFASRHVNTWGQGIAEDIIAGVQQFCQEHPFANPDKVGCIGASYGGFMTMYLQTVTDIFACAISHAGISNIASYWGEGYWGYSYGEIVSAHSYPWNAKDMYTNQSPLFAADKIHTPLLLLHGQADTNVPVIESISMFTALKLLQRDVAFVQFPGENHWILDYNKRLKWMNTIMAWFAKYLQDDPAWWEALYPAKAF